MLKDCGGVGVCAGVRFSLAKVRGYGLLCENGAGKATLMKILSGFEQPTSGTLLVDGRATHFNGSRQAEAAGIVLIHQEINLAEDLTIDRKSTRLNSSH